MVVDILKFYLAPTLYSFSYILSFDIIIFTPILIPHSNTLNIKIYKFVIML